MYMYLECKVIQNNIYSSTKYQSINNENKGFSFTLIYKKWQQVDIMSMKMHRYINVTQYIRITTRHGIAGIIVGFDGVIFKCILTP